MEQKVWYYDKEARGNSPSNFPSAQQIIPAGKIIQPRYPSCEVSSVNRILAEQYDFHFNFPKDLPQFTFYPVPKLLIFAIDSHGGTFVTTDDSVNIPEDKASIFYLSHDRALHYLAPNLHGLLSLLVFQPDWRTTLGLDTIPTPNPSEKGHDYLIKSLNLSRVSLPETSPQTEIRLFPTLAAAKAVLPFIDPLAPSSL